MFQHRLCSYNAHTITYRLLYEIDNNTIKRLLTAYNSISRNVKTLIFDLSSTSWIKTPTCPPCLSFNIAPYFLLQNSTTVPSVGILLQYFGYCILHIVNIENITEAIKRRNCYKTSSFNYINICSTVIYGILSLKVRGSKGSLVQLISITLRFQIDFYQIINNKFIYRFFTTHSAFVRCPLVLGPATQLAITG